MKLLHDLPEGRCLTEKDDELAARAPLKLLAVLFPPRADKTAVWHTFVMYVVLCLAGTR